MKAVISVFALLLMLTGCNTWRKVVETDNQERVTRTDSIIERINTEVKPVNIPVSLSVMLLPDSQLRSLPEGGSFTKKEGRATATITRRGDSYEVSANCDSLSVLVESVTRDLYRSRTESDSLRLVVKEFKTEVIKEPSGWQWFQIWGFRLMLAAVALYVLFKNVDVWQLIKKLPAQISRLIRKN